MKSALASGVLALVAISAPANAATFVAAGDSHIVHFDGFAGGVVNGLTSKLTLTFNGFTNGGTLANFSYTIANTSAAPVTASRVSSFGWDIDTPNFSFANSTESSPTYSLRDGGQFPQPNDGGGPREFCLSAGPNCGGGAGGGILLGGSETSSFAIAFTSSQAQVALSNFVARYQSIDGAGQVSSAIGRPTTPPPPPPPVVPEPATWAMLIIGFGLVGSAMRRRQGVASVSA